MGDQSRFQRWEAGLIAAPNLIFERDLDICLMKQTRRSIYRGGYLQFENLTYRGKNLAGYAGESVALRYDPRDITTVLVYRTEGDREVFLARAYAQDLETEQLSIDEAKASSRKVREAGKAVSNRSILAGAIAKLSSLRRKRKRNAKRPNKVKSVRQNSLYLWNRNPRKWYRTTVKLNQKCQKYLITNKCGKITGGKK